MCLWALALLLRRCSWGRVLIRGNGPLRRLMQGRDMISSFLFDKWRRFYFSLDEFGLFMYDNKFDTAAFCGIPVKDLRRVRVEKAIPVRHSPHEAGKNIVEDIHNVMLTTYSGDELYMRCAIFIRMAQINARLCLTHLSLTDCFSTDLFLVQLIFWFNLFGALTCDGADS